MASERVTGTQWTCDGCEVTEFVRDEPELPGEGHTPNPPPPKEWIRGSAEAGPIDGWWVAHTTKCIQKAVQSVINPGGS